MYLIIKPIVQWKEPGRYRTPGRGALSGEISDSSGRNSVFRAAARRRPDRRRLSVRGGVHPRRIEEAGKGSARTVGQPIAGGFGRPVVGSSGERQRLSHGRRRRGELLLKVSRSAPPLLDQLRSTKPVGRLVIDINRVLKGPSGVSGDVLVKDGDKLIVPKKTQEVTILGEVQSPTSHVFQAGLTRDEYIAKSGGVTQKAEQEANLRGSCERRCRIGRALPVVQALAVDRDAAGGYDCRAARHGAGARIWRFGRRLRRSSTIWPWDSSWCINTCSVHGSAKIVRRQYRWRLAANS